MKLIIPMAGMGKRMRPHTLTIPKPLIKIAGKSIVNHLVDEIINSIDEVIDEIGFIIGDFGESVEKELIKIAEGVGAKGKLFYQNEALGTAHAIYMAKEMLSDNIIVAFADTLLIADFKLDKNADSIIWVKEVSNPEAFGVVKLDEKEIITDFIEKPKTHVSNLAIIGIYYFKDGLNLKNEIKYLIDNKITGNGEYQLTDVLHNMLNNKKIFKAGKVKNWMDCGNKNATVNTQKTVLENFNLQKRGVNIVIKNSVIIEPVFIDDNIEIINSVIGPYVSIGKNSLIDKCIVSNSIIQENTELLYKNVYNSMIGSFVSIKGNPEDLSIGDYNQIH